MPLPDRSQLEKDVRREGLTSATAYRFYGATDPVEARKLQLRQGYKGKSLLRIAWWENGWMTEQTEPHNEYLPRDADMSTVWFELRGGEVLRLHFIWVLGPQGSLAADPKFPDQVATLLNRKTEKLLRAPGELMASLHLNAWRNPAVLSQVKITSATLGDDWISSITTASVLTQVYRVGLSGYGSARWLKSSERVKENWWVVNPQRPSALTVVSYSSRKSRKNGQSRYRCAQGSCEEFSGRSLLALLKQADYDLTRTLKLVCEQNRAWFTAEGHDVAAYPQDGGRRSCGRSPS